MYSLYQLLYWNTIFLYLSAYVMTFLYLSVFLKGASDCTLVTKMLSIYVESSLFLLDYFLKWSPALLHKNFTISLLYYFVHYNLVSHTCICLLYYCIQIDLRNNSATHTTSKIAFHQYEKTIMIYKTHNLERKQSIKKQNTSIYNCKPLSSGIWVILFSLLICFLLIFQH